MKYAEEMMGKPSNQKRSDVLSASEIGQYVFCPNAWKLRRLGYQPVSALLEPGKQKHVALGRRIDRLQQKSRYAWWCALIGGVALGVALLFLFFGVIV